MCCFLIFFFKQKTAYEMRISDWSSDVCFSDLDLLQFLRHVEDRVVDTQLLMLRIATVDDRPKEQPRRQKRGRNPQHRALHMPGAGQRIGEILRDIDAVEALPLDRVVRGEAADEHLTDEQRDHYKKIFRTEEHTLQLKSIMHNSS